MKNSLGLVLWIVAAALPIWMFDLYWSYRASIGCPATGDCYVPGWWHAEKLNLVAVVSAAAIWPLALWQLVKLAARRWKRGGRPQS